MTKNIWIAFSLTAAVALSACGKKLDSSKEIDDVVKKNQQELAKIPEQELAKIPTPQAPSVVLPSEQGGQPGSVTIQGAMADERNRLNPLISVRSDAGVGIDGKRPALEASSRPAVSAKTDLKELKAELDDKSVVSIGECNDEFVGRIAAENGFKVVPFAEAPSDDAVQVVRANSVILCGKISFKKPFVSIAAANLVLTNVSWDIKGELGYVALSAEKLILEGANRISLVATPGALIAPALLLKVRGEFLPSAGARLDIESIGGDGVKKDAAKK